MIGKEKIEQDLLPHDYKHLSFEEAEMVERSIPSIKDISLSVTDLVTLAHSNAVHSGWWTWERNKAELLMLIVSEVAEAMEGERKNLLDDHLPHRRMAEVELADAVIRIADYCGAYGYDLEGAIKEKLEYNKNRADHKPENRALPHGKKF